ncbi:MAG TPA: LacI family DNA-binding transcriptional regulator [Lacisediminihabitans sp.]|uniref:LacI family DNA-binding transcriptional regulator n=1 Tax=Lacisediminihabitans sp. TaxID=2787631 RepID=UPI002ED8DABC
MTISEVARWAGVSIGTVSNALNHPDKVRQVTRKRVEQAIVELGFVPNHNARTLAGGPNPTFGLILTGLDHGMTLQLAQGAQDAAHHKGFELLIASVDNNDVLENRYLDYFVGAQMAGLLLEPRADSKWRLGAEGKIPSVALDVRGDPADGCSVAADNLQEGRLGAQHGLALGRERIAVVTSPDPIRSLIERLDGIRAVLGSASVAEAEEHIVPMWRDRDSARELGRTLGRRDKRRRPDFIIGLTDVLAAGIIDGLLDEGVRVPEDVAVMGCDGNQMAWDGPIPMTTIVPHGYRMGVSGVELLTAELTEAGAHHHTFDLIEPELLVKESTVGRPTPR